MGTTLFDVADRLFSHFDFAHRPMDLTLFGAGSPSVTKDDPNDPDDDPAPAGDDDQDDLALDDDDDPDDNDDQGDDDPDDDDQDDPDDDDKPEPEDTKAKPDKKPAKPDPKQPDTGFYRSQAEFDRAITERLNRDRKYQQMREFEALTGVPLEQALEQVRKNQVEYAQEQYGMTPEQARQYAEALEKSRRLESVEAERQQQEAATRSINTYLIGKAKHLKNPWAKKFEKEIDDFAHDGAIGVDYETALNYVVGQKILSGEIDMQKVTEQKVIRNIEKRDRVAPVAPKGTPKEVALTPMQKAVARNLGISEERYAKNLVATQKKEKRRAR